MLQAAMANQNADLQAQQLSEQSLQALRNTQLDALRGQTSLYGTTPGLASTFGNQALQAYQNRINLEQLRNQTGLGLLGRQIEAYGGQQASEPWWKQLLGMAGSAMNMLGAPKVPTSMGPSGSTPVGYNTPSGFPGTQGTSFQGYQPTMPTAPPGNYNTSSNWYVNDPNMGYGGGNFGGGDPMNTDFWAGGAGGGWNDWGNFGGGGGYWNPYEGGGSYYTGYTDWMPSGGGGNYYGGTYNPSYYD